MMLCAAGASLGQSDLVLSQFLEADVVVVAAPGHELAQRHAVPMVELAQFRCAGAATQDFRNDALFGPGAGENASAFMANDYEALLPLALGGHAVLVAPAFVVRRALDEGRLVQLDMEKAFRVEFVTVMTTAASASPILAKIAGYASDLGDAVMAEWRGRLH